ncbi:hypothetical protein RJ639_021582, partial [Escallonia herrerae]
MRKRDDGAFTYAVHADYYILLRSCARVVKVDGRSLHFGVLSFEKRLDWLEKRIDHCLRMNPLSDTCQFCSDEGQQNAKDDPINLSNLNLSKQALQINEEDASGFAEVGIADGNIVLAGADIYNTRILYLVIKIQ